MLPLGVSPSPASVMLYRLRLELLRTLRPLLPALRDFRLLEDSSPLRDFLEPSGETISPLPHLSLLPFPSITLERPRKKLKMLATVPVSPTTLRTPPDPGEEAAGTVTTPLAGSLSNCPGSPLLVTATLGCQPATAAARTAAALFPSAPSGFPLVGVSSPSGLFDSSGSSKASDDMLPTEERRSARKPVRLRPERASGESSRLLRARRPDSARSARVDGRRMVCAVSDMSARVGESIRNVPSYSISLVLVLPRRRKAVVKPSSVCRAVGLSSDPTETELLNSPPPPEMLNRGLPPLKGELPLELLCCRCCSCASMKVWRR
mmetsp:Transcript_13017/g.31415  ORF Transcript_13017/g.31415 Transcript_13017/m.31415 type:complete len:320 (-) Transcript_13017:338-1297(-)